MPFFLSGFSRAGAVCTALLSVAASAASNYWVIAPPTTPAQVVHDANTGEVILSNGLIERTLSSTYSLAVTRSLKNLHTGAEMLVGMQPEAVIDLDGQRFYVGQGTSPSTTFIFDSLFIGATAKPYEWTPKRGAAPAPWPPLGRAVTLYYKPDPVIPAAFQGVRVAVRYEIYQGLPALCKTVTVMNRGTREFKVTYLASEQLAVKPDLRGRFYLETDFHGAGGGGDFNDNVWRRHDVGRTIQWTDTAGHSLARSRYDIGPDRRIAAGQSFTGFRTFELLHSVDPLEWREMEIKKLYRTVAPQVTENPIFMHLISDDSQTLRGMVDQCASVGFEMIIQSFGSGLNVESTDPAYISRRKADYDYAHSKGVEVGGYTLLVVGDGGSDGTLSGSTGWGTVRCMASAWMDRYWKNVSGFIEQTGLDMMEIDGVYPLFACNSTSHAHHDGLNDSRLRQWQHSTINMGNFFRSRNMYTNAPDWFYLNGYSKNAIGYWEDTWSLPRQQQQLAGRLFIYDGTYQKTPSMGWTFTPIDQYKGGGAAATLEPLSQNRKDYDWVLAQNFMSGVMSCYRGGRLYDNDSTQAVVKKWVDFYKKYRDILNSDIVHIRRPQANPANRARAMGLDALMHANPQTQVKGLVAVWNQTDQAITDTLVVPLFYTGLTDLTDPPEPISKATEGVSTWPAWPPADPFPTWAFTADQPYPSAGTPALRRVLVRREAADSTLYAIDSKGNIRVPISLPAMSYTWYTVHPGTPPGRIANATKAGLLWAEAKGNRILFHPASTGEVSVVLYNPRGAEVRALLREPCLAKPYEITWDGRDNGGRPVSRGRYLCKVSLGDRSITVPIQAAP